MSEIQAKHVREGYKFGGEYVFTDQDGERFTLPARIFNAFFEPAEDPVKSNYEQTPGIRRAG